MSYRPAYELDDGSGSARPLTPAEAACYEWLVESNAAVASGTHAVKRRSESALDRHHRLTTDYRERLRLLDWVETHWRQIRRSTLAEQFGKAGNSAA